jgi:hypothetical protein
MYGYTQEDKKYLPVEQSVEYRPIVIDFYYHKVRIGRVFRNQQVLK